MKTQFDYALLPPPVEAGGLGEDELWDARHARLCAIGGIYGFESSQWSLDEDVDFAAVAFAGRWRVRHSAWSDHVIHTPVLQDPTWLALWAAADYAIAGSGDSHHIFVEGFDPDGEGILELGTGS